MSGNCRAKAAADTRDAAPPGGSVHCACHAKGSRGPSGGNPQQQLVQAALCTAPATQKGATASILEQNGISVAEDGMPLF